jgi:hypothetical protein
MHEHCQGSIVLRIIQYGVSGYDVCELACERKLAQPSFTITPFKASSYNENLVHGLLSIDLEK